MSVLVGLAIGGGVPDHFQIREVRVCCVDESLRQEAGEQAARLQYGSICLPPTREIERTIGGLARALDVTIRRDPPDALVITVHPRQPVAVVTVDERAMMIDEEGVCLNWTGSASDSMMVLHIADPYALKVGSTLNGRDAELFSELLSGLREVNLVAGTSADIASRYRVTIFTREGVLGKLGDPELLRAKTIFFGKLLACLRACRRNPLYIDLRVPSRPTYRPVN
jgi:cell division septal protein FtsQ